MAGKLMSTLRRYFHTMNPTRILDLEEYKQELRTKLQEESEEYMSAGSDQEALEELADMLEVIRALAKVHGANAAQFG